MKRDKYTKKGTNIRRERQIHREKDTFKGRYREKDRERERE